MDVNGHERLSNITLRQEFKKLKSTFIAVLLFTVTVRSLINEQYPKMSVKQLLSLKPVGSYHTDKI
jgi:hypothetical protein